MKLIIRYGKKFEINRIKFSLERLDWYKSHNYKPILPKGIETEKQIANFIEKDFYEKDFENKRRDLLKEYKKINKEFVKRIMKYFHNVPKEVEVILTKYGVGGSYSLPNKVIINIQANKPLIKILKHEILHLLSEEEILKKGLSQEEKEEFIRNIEENF